MAARDPCSQARRNTPYAQRSTRADTARHGTGSCLSPKTPGRLHRTLARTIVFAPHGLSGLDLLLDSFRTTRIQPGYSCGRLQNQAQSSPLSHVRAHAPTARQHTKGHNLRFATALDGRHHHHSSHPSNHVRQHPRCCSFFSPSAPSTPSFLLLRRCSRPSPAPHSLEQQQLRRQEPQNVAIAALVAAVLLHEPALVATAPPISRVGSHEEWPCRRPEHGCASDLLRQFPSLRMFAWPTY